MKIAVLGAGSLGCAMGANLSEAGHEVWLINRNAAHVQAMRAQGLRVRTEGVERLVPVYAVQRADEVTGGPVDLLVVLVKSFHTQEAIASARALVGPQTAVLSLQNGLGHEELLAAAVGADKVLVGRTFVGGQLLGPGHVLQSIAGRQTQIGELDGRLSERVLRIAQVFNQAGLSTLASDNIVGTIWDKLFVNVATGALSGITGLSYGPLYEVPELQACALAAVSEAMAVARACGVRFATQDPEEPWHKAGAGLPAEFKASMLQSLDKGSVTEVDYVNGAVLRWGRKHGVPTPVNETLLACIKGIESRVSRPVCG